MTEPLLLPVQVASDITGLTVRQLRDLAREKRIPHRKIGALLRFTRDDIDQIIAGFAVKPAVTQPTAQKRRAS